MNWWVFSAFLLMGGVGYTTGLQHGSDQAELAAAVQGHWPVAASSGGILPSPEQGEFIFVQNSGANALNVYPASGHSINALAANAAFSLAAGKNAVFWAATASKWYANLSA